MTREEDTLMQEVKKLELLLDEKTESKAKIFGDATPAKAYGGLVRILRRNLLELIAGKIAKEPEKYFSKEKWSDVLLDLKGDEKDKIKCIAYCVAGELLGEAFHQRIEQYENSNQDYDGTYLCLAADEQIADYISKRLEEAEKEDENGRE